MEVTQAGGAVGEDGEMAGGVPGYYIGRFGVPGSGAFRNALDYYAQQALGPEGAGPGNLAGAEATDTAAGQYYSTPTPLDTTSGSGQTSAQGAFGNLLTGEASANNAAAATNAQTRSQAGAGVLGATQGYASDIAANIQAQMALNEAKGTSSVQNAGLLSGLLGSFINPQGAGSQVVNAFTGGNTSGLAEGVGAGKGLLSGLFSNPASFADPLTLNAIATPDLAMPIDTSLFSGLALPAVSI
jgi:hypothetical protein